MGTLKNVMCVNYCLRVANMEGLKMSHPYSGEYHEDLQLEVGEVKRPYRARWGRLAIVWVGIVAVIVGCSMLLGCSPAIAYEDSHSLPIPVLTIMAEAGGEGFDGMEAVANVIRNRAKRRGLTVEQVCLQPKQFSCWNDGGRAVYAYAERNRAVWDDALTAWQVSGTEDVTSGADHYFADYIKRPKWALGMAFKGRVGKHLFYRS